MTLVTLDTHVSDIVTLLPQSRTVYARLEQLEKDTLENIHLENKVLFERVREYL